jgi:hypothetical protein
MIVNRGNPELLGAQLVELYGMDFLGKAAPKRKAPPKPAPRPAARPAARPAPKPAAKPAPRPVAAARPAPRPVATTARPAPAPRPAAPAAKPKPKKKSFLQKATSAVKRGAKVVAKSPVAKVAMFPAQTAIKAGKFIANPTKKNLGNLAVAATVLPTAGASLLAKKNVRKAVGKAAGATGSGLTSAAKFTAKKIVKPLARQPLVQKAAETAFRSFVPGGSAALDAASLLKARKPARKAPTAAPAAARASAPPPARRAPGAFQLPFRPRPASAPAAPPDAPAPAEPPMAKAGVSLPLVLGAAGVGAALLFMAGNRK